MGMKYMGMRVPTFWPFLGEILYSACDFSTEKTLPEFDTKS